MYCLPAGQFGAHGTRDVHRGPKAPAGRRARGSSFSSSSSSARGARAGTTGKGQGCMMHAVTPRSTGGGSSARTAPEMGNAAQRLRSEQRGHGMWIVDVRAATLTFARADSERLRGGACLSPLRACRSCGLVRQAECAAGRACPRFAHADAAGSSVRLIARRGVLVPASRLPKLLARPPG